MFSGKDRRWNELTIDEPLELLLYRALLFSGSVSMFFHFNAYSNMSVVVLRNGYALGVTNYYVFASLLIAQTALRSFSLFCSTCTLIQFDMYFREDAAGHIHTSSVIFSCIPVCVTESLTFLLMLLSVLLLLVAHSLSLVSVITHRHLCPRHCDHSQRVASEADTSTERGQTPQEGEEWEWQTLSSRSSAALSSLSSAAISSLEPLLSRALSRRARRLAPLTSAPLASSRLPPRRHHSKLFATLVNLSLWNLRNSLIVCSVGGSRAVTKILPLGGYLGLCS